MMINKKNDIDKDGLNEVIHLSKNLLRVFYIITIIGIIIGALFVIKYLSIFQFLLGVLKVISPLFIGYVIAWFFYPLHKKMLDKGIPKILSSILIFLLLVGSIVILIYVFIPVISNQINDLVSYIPSVFGGVSNFITSIINKLDIKGVDLTSIKSSFSSSFENLVLNLTSSLPNNVLSFIKGILSALGIILISIVIGIYMLIEYDNLTVSIHKILPKKHRNDYIKLIENISANARKVVNSTLFVAFLVFVFDTIGFALIGLKSAMLFGLFCGITDLIPYIGPYIGGGVAVIVGFTQGPVVGIGVLIVAIIVQVLESYILQPVVMSKAMKLSPITIIVALLLFGYFFGILGMVLATPCIAIIKEIVIFIKEKVISRRK